MGTRRPLIALLILAAMFAAASPAAADRVYFASNGISFVGLDGSGGGQLNTAGASTAGPAGMAIDPAAGKIYWASGAGAQSRISVANLDGSGGMDLPITGAPLDNPYGVALDLDAGRIYWANYQGTATERIGFAKLDGSGGGFLNTTGATASNPTGVALDPDVGRIYWSNENGKISYANLDGSGGADLNTTGATTGGIHAEGVAIDRAGGRIYWVTYGIAIPYPGYLSYARLDGSGGADVSTTIANGAFPWGVALDPGANRAYWANNTHGLGTPSISFTGLDGGSIHDLDLDGAPSQSARLPTLLEAPLGTGAPKVTAQIALRPRFLTCDEGTWAADMPEALLYRAPHSFSYRWLKDGQPIPGATHSNIGVEGTGGGDYVCEVTATNAGGSTTQTSRAQFVCCRQVPQTIAKAARIVWVKRGRARVRLGCPSGGTNCTGKVFLFSFIHRKGGMVAAAQAPIGREGFSITSGKRGVVAVRLERLAKTRLRNSPHHRFRARLTGTGVEPRAVLLKLAKQRRKQR